MKVLTDINILNKVFSEINLTDSFFDSFKEDYAGFNKWFQKKSDETVYATINNGKILSFLYLKIEDKNENYSDITPIFTPKRRLKIGTFKVINSGVHLGERFMKIVFDNAIQYKVEEIYVTIFDKREEQERLIGLLENWGFKLHGIKSTTSGTELVYVRDLKPKFFISENLQFSFLYLSKNSNKFALRIYPNYQTDFIPDTILTTASPYYFLKSQPYSNAIRDAFISQSLERNINKGDIIVFDRSTAKDRFTNFSSFITTIAIAERKITDIRNESIIVDKTRIC